MLPLRSSLLFQPQGIAVAIALFGLLCLGIIPMRQAHGQTKATQAPAAESPERSQANGALKGPQRMTLITGEETMQLAEFPLSITQEPGIMLPVTWKGKTYTFMLDTGATSTVVDEPLRALLGEVVERNHAEPPAGEKVAIDLYASMDDAMVGPLSLKDCGLVSVSDFKATRDEFDGVKCDGVLGMTFIGKYLWIIDWDYKKICVNESVAPLAKKQARAKLKKGPGLMQWVPIMLPDGKATAVLDTGYGSALGIEDARFEAMEKSGAISNVHPYKLPTFAGVRPVKIGYLSEFMLPRGSETDILPRVMVTSSNRMRLGLSFLKAYSVMWDVPNDFLLLMPRSALEPSLRAKGIPILPVPLGVPTPKTVPTTAAAKPAGTTPQNPPAPMPEPLASIRYESLETFKFDENERGIFLPVKAFGQMQWWHFDTGTSIHTFALDAESKLGEPLRTDDFTGGLGKMKMNIYPAPSDWLLGPERLHGPVSVLNLQRFSELSGRQLGGMIGASLLLRYMVVINFDTGELDLAVPPGGGKAVAADVLQKGIGTVPDITVALPDGKSEAFILDSGATGWINLAGATFDRLAAAGHVTGVRTEIVTVGEGQKLETKAGKISTFSFGGRKFENLTATRMAGNGVGLPFMRQWNWIFNYPDGKMTMSNRLRPPPVADPVIAPVPDSPVPLKKTPPAPAPVPAPKPAVPGGTPKLPRKVSVGMG